VKRVTLQERDRLFNENKNLRKLLFDKDLVQMLLDKDAAKIKVKVLVSFGDLNQLADVITKLKKIREIHDDVVIEVDFRTISTGQPTEED
jgi:hypothetical protein